MLFHGTGWYQFGARYLLDTMPFLLILVAFGMRGRLRRRRGADSPQHCRERLGEPIGSTWSNPKGNWSHLLGRSVS